MVWVLLIYNMKTSLLKKIGPGLIFAGAAIGVSHLVQATRGGADYGFGLLWALLLIHAVKYPFFQFAPRYTTATGETLIDGYKRLGKGVLILYFTLTLATMFTIQAAVTIVTAGLAKYLFGITGNTLIWSAALIIFSAIILFKGRYSLLDKLMKAIVIVLSITTIIAVITAAFYSENSFNATPVIPQNALEVGFLIAFLGWMPAPLDVSVWQSIWTQEKQQSIGQAFDTDQSLFDFNIGYIGTVITGFLFMALGAYILYRSGVELSPKAGVFANQLIDMYNTSLGKVIGWIVGIAAFATMFSTTITALDASPKVMAKTTGLLFGKKFKYSYLFWLAMLSMGSIFILAFFKTGMGTMVKIATIVSFLTAPFYAIANLWLVSGKNMPKSWRPGKALRIWSIMGILFLTGFSVWYLSILL
jgi:Mn2+/Fe2+ NRAMP family transporter